MKKTFFAAAIGFLLGVSVVALAQPSNCGSCLVNTVRGILDDLDGRGWVGLLVTTHPGMTGSVQVLILQAESPALASEMRSGDRIEAINGVRLHAESAEATMLHYRELISEVRPGQRVRFSAVRGEEELEIEIVAARYSFWARRDAVGGELIRQTHLGNYQARAR